MEIRQSPKTIQSQTIIELFGHQFPSQFSYIEPTILTKGGTLLLGGHAKVGKSLVMMEVIRSLSCGKPLFGNPEFEVPKTVRCLLVEMENGPRSIKDRGLKIFEDEDPEIYGDNFHVISYEHLLQLDTSAGLKYFTDLLKDVRPNVMVLDPISFMHSQEEISADGIQRVVNAIIKLKTLDITKESEMSVVMSHHFGKKPWGAGAQGYDALSDYNFRGSSKWKDMADSLITMDRSEEMRGVGWEAWKLKMRFLCRHGSSPKDIVCHVNERGDLRVRHFTTHKEMRKIKVVPMKSFAEAAEEQGALPWT